MVYIASVCRINLQADIRAHSRGVYMAKGGDWWWLIGVRWNLRFWNVPKFLLVQIGSQTQPCLEIRLCGGGFVFCFRINWVIVDSEDFWPLAGQVPRLRAFLQRWNKYVRWFMQRRKENQSLPTPSVQWGSCCGEPWGRPHFVCVKSPISSFVTPCPTGHPEAKWGCECLMLMAENTNMQSAAAIKTRQEPHRVHRNHSALKDAFYYHHENVPVTSDTGVELWKEMIVIVIQLCTF